MYFLRQLSVGSEKKIHILEGFPMSTTLPKPVVAASASTGRQRPKKKARFGVAAGYWATIKGRFGTVSSPSLSSSEFHASSTENQSHKGAEEVPGDPDRVRQSSCVCTIRQLVYRWTELWSIGRGPANPAVVRHCSRTATTKVPKQNLVTA